MTHGFDDQGRKYNENGRLENWWTEEDEQEFMKRAQEDGEQFANFTEGLPDGVHINSALTMGENIADLGGLTMALQAYRNSLPELGHRTTLRTPFVMDRQDGLEGERRFFLGYAQVWRETCRVDALKRQVATDPHPPAISRVAIPTRNMDGWYTAFDIAEDSAMYLPTDQRVSIW